VYPLATSFAHPKPGKRLLRITASAAFLAAGAVLFAAWMRNFCWADVVWAPLPGARQMTIASSDGQIEVGILRPTRWSPKPEGWGRATYTASQNRVLEVFVPWNKVIRYRFTINRSMAIVLPHWLLTLAMLMLAAVPWIRWSRRFTIRTMLVVTTLIAVVLALAVTAGD
jgi:hypothetical protein